MPYFADHYERIAYRLPANGTAGLYNAQIGAIHALAAHFTVDDQPAIVTMPTGSGKTAVLMMLPFILRSNRVLVITPSRLVRGQIAEEFKTLNTLHEIGVLPADVPAPRILELDERITSAQDWEDLRDYDVIVSTPNCTSPGYENIPAPPGDLFDLLLIDEAHHSPAHTWASLLEALKTSRRALFSATPFRRDRGEIPGRFVYNYPITRAYADRIFGRISYVQAFPNGGETSDMAIARMTAEVFAEDRRRGLNHYVMVRTDRKPRAEQLADIYQRQTQLRLKVVHSGLSPRTVKKVLEALGRGELDGVICVNMMGEGFNFPRLKIAAVHVPYKSLEVTLQFIGRFARTNDPDIGEAKFIAALSELEIERRKLFDEGAVWQEIIPELSYGRIANEIHIREVLQEFREPEGSDTRLEDLSLYSLYPRTHVKVYDTQLPVDFRTVDYQPGGAHELCYRNVNGEGNALVLITRAIIAPKWSKGQSIVDTTYDLYVLYYDTDTGLLFINSSRSIDGTYENLAEAVAPGATPLATGQVGRVVKDIINKRLFNLGMRNLQAANTRESYKIVTGSDAQIDPADARRYRQGHAFLGGEEGGRRVTIGYSSGGKVWSSLNIQIPELVDWCKILGRKIRSTDPLVTNSGLDYLDAGKVVTRIPDHLIFAQWNRDAFDFTTPVQIHYIKDDGTERAGHILDLDITINRDGTNQTEIRVTVAGEGLAIPVTFSLDDFYTSPDNSGERVTVVRGNYSTSLIEYLNESLPDFYTANGSLFTGNELFEPKEMPRLIREDQLVVWQWDGVAIEAEVVPARGLRTVQDKVRATLERGPGAVVLFDHGTGEMADFITITEESEVTSVAFYHCKGSETPLPGARIDDLYDVCGQAQKSVAWASLARFERRLRDRRSIQFVVGTEERLREILLRAKDRRQRFEIKMVQPGVSKAELSQSMAECLGATNTHLAGVGAPLELICSA
jgi:superfamily II DNA or RNA helicase